MVDGVLRACQAPGIAGEVMNVATGGRISLNELLRTLCELLGVRTQAVFKEQRAGDVRDSQADISRARALTGYVPIVDLRGGLERTLAWFRA